MTINVTQKDFTSGFCVWQLHYCAMSFVRTLPDLNFAFDTKTLIIMRGGLAALAT